MPLLLAEVVNYVTNTRDSSLRYERKNAPSGDEVSNQRILQWAMMPRSHAADGLCRFLGSHDMAELTLQRP